MNQAVPQNSTVVAKFGGTSVADFEAMNRSADVVLANPQVRLVVLSASAGVTNETLYGLMFTLIPAAHIFAQLKEGYALGWFSAAWRTVLLATLALVTLTGFFVGIALLGLLD